jgi:phosphatidate cytidylyltransferase
MKNYVTRSISGIIYVFLISFSILYKPYSYASLFAIVTGLCLWEFYYLLEKNGESRINKPIATIGGVYLFISGFLWFSEKAFPAKYLALWFIIMLYLFINGLYTKDEHSLRNIAYTFFGQIYIALPFMFLSRLGYSTDIVGQPFYNPIFLMSFFVLIWVSDTGAYLVGSTLGKHKLFERISPHKTWEGSIGGSILAIIAAIAISQIFPGNLTFCQWIGFSLITVIFGTWGDLFESLIKRSLKVKDSGHMIPGHGGILDRFDSCLLAAPAIVIYYLFIH